MSDKRPPSRANRLCRRCGLDRNDLRRRIDRVQWLVAVLLILVFVAAAPGVSFWFGKRVYDSGMRTERHEHTTRHLVTATVVGPGGLGGGEAERYIHQTVRATWPLPGGKQRTGMIPSWSGAKVGTTRRIWINDQGGQTVRPRPHGRTVADAAYVATAAVLGIGLPLLIGYGLVKRHYDRTRSALWDADWARLDTPKIG